MLADVFTIPVVAVSYGCFSLFYAMIIFEYANRAVIMLEWYLLTVLTVVMATLDNVTFQLKLFSVE